MLSLAPAALRTPALRPDSPRNPHLQTPAEVAWWQLQQSACRSSPPGWGSPVAPGPAGAAAAE
eukprot:3771839-Lingulodinium_polyedra.AAC.1